MAYAQQSVLVPWFLTGVVFSNTSVVKGLEEGFLTFFSVQEAHKTNVVRITNNLFIYDKDTIF